MQPSMNIHEGKRLDMRRAKIKGMLVFLQELGVALQDEWQQIPRAEIHHIISVCPTGVVNGLLYVEVTSDIDLDSISFMCSR